MTIKSRPKWQGRKLFCNSLSQAKFPRTVTEKRATFSFLSAYIWYILNVTRVVFLTQLYPRNQRLTKSVNKIDIENGAVLPEDLDLFF